MTRARNGQVRVLPALPSGPPTSTTVFLHGPIKIELRLHRNHHDCVLRPSYNHFRFDRAAVERVAVLSRKNVVFNCHSARKRAPAAALPAHARTRACVLSAVHGDRVRISSEPCCCCFGCFLSMWVVWFVRFVAFRMYTLKTSALPVDQLRAVLDFHCARIYFICCFSKAQFKQ